MNPEAIESGFIGSNYCRTIALRKLAVRMKRLAMDVENEGGGYFIAARNIASAGVDRLSDEDYARKEKEDLDFQVANVESNILSELAATFTELADGYPDLKSSWEEKVAKRK